MARRKSPFGGDLGDTGDHMLHPAGIKDKLASDATQGIDLPATGVIAGASLDQITTECPLGPKEKPTFTDYAPCIGTNPIITYYSPSQAQKMTEIRVRLKNG